MSSSSSADYRPQSSIGWGLLPQSSYDIYIQNTYLLGINYAIEYIILTLLGIYIINYFYGKRKNSTIAFSIYTTLQSYLQTQFSHIGDSDTNNLIHQSNTDYLLYASGRQYVHSMLCHIHLNNRLDLISEITRIIFYGTTLQDYILIDIPLDNNIIDKYIVALIRKRIQKVFIKTNDDVSNIANITINDIHTSVNKFVVLTDSRDAYNQVFNSNTIDDIIQYNQYIDYILISDISTILHDNTTKNVLRAKIYIPKDHNDLIPIFTLLLQLVDRLHNIHIIGQQRNKNIEKRDLYNKQLQSKQQLQNKNKDSGNNNNVVELTAEQREKKEQRKLRKKQFKVVR